MVTPRELAEVAAEWDLRIREVKPALPLAGSPERSEYRIVIGSMDDRDLIFEKISAESYARKQRIGQTLSWLKGRGLSKVAPPLVCRSGRMICEVHGDFWQVTPFVPGIELDRPAYVHQEWRARVLVDFLNGMRRASEGLRYFEDDRPLDLMAYISGLMEVIRQRRPEVYQAAVPFMDRVVNELGPVYGALPLGFCHGDFHPLNIIWLPQGIAAVIDWEFTGIKPELYDAANLVGCLGIEDPEALTGPLVRGVVRELRASGLYNVESFVHLSSLVRAQRFAWLSEWLRKKDEAMIEMELDYWRILERLEFRYTGKSG